jgi:hypothetical protein
MDSTKHVYDLIRQGQAGEGTKHDNPVEGMIDRWTKGLRSPNGLVDGSMPPKTHHARTASKPGARGRLGAGGPRARCS